MSRYLRLIRSVMRGIRRSYTVWQMNEISRSGKELYSCASCGMARSEPCEHWQNMIADHELGGAGVEKGERG